MTPSKMIFAAVIALGALGANLAPASAMSMAPGSAVEQAGAGVSVEQAGWRCGPGWHVNRWGRCVPNGHPVWHHRRWHRHGGWHHRRWYR